ncbi:MAG: YdcF family protein [Myxococcales bacterium]|nr:YdcF family protein [Myxococcales bacterium]
MLLIVGLFAAAAGARVLRRPTETPTRARRLGGGLVLVGLALVALGAPRGLMLSKSIGLSLMPMGLLWWGALSTSLVAIVRGERRLALAAVALTLALSLVGSEPLASVALRAVEGEHHGSRPFEGDALDAIFVLGGGTDDRPAGDVRVGASGDRVVLAARLYHLGRAPTIGVSGSAIEGMFSHDAVAASAHILSQLGVPDEAIVRVEGARTTSEEAARYAALARERGLRRVGLVTSAFHMRRALRLFDAEGLAVVPLPADVRGRPVVWRGLYSLIPSGHAASELQTACWEWLGALAGR